jgi:two-component system, OmpR family, sensor histidine kinase MprB
MTLRVRLALVGALVAVIAAGSSALVSYHLLANRVFDSLDHSLETTSWLFKDEPRRSPFADPFQGQDIGQYAVQALTPDSKTLSLAGPPLPVAGGDVEVALGRKGRTFRNVQVEAGSWRMLTAATRYGAVQVAVETEDTEQLIKTLRILSAGVGFVLSVGGAALAWGVAGRALSPLRHLTDAVERVAEGELDVRVDAASQDEIGRVAAAFNRTMDALRRSRAEQRRLIQDAGHDLRTPLTSITTNISILQRLPLDADERCEVLDDLACEARNLTGLVNEIIDLATGLDVHELPEPVEVDRLLDELAARSARLHARDVSWEGEPLTAEIRPRAFERAVSNLLENAVKFSGGPVDLRLEQRGAYGWVWVADRGIGIAAEDCEAIFQRFWRAESSRSSKGSGLGLAIVKDVAERHGGAVSARPRYGGGAEIGFSFVAGTRLRESARARTPRAHQPRSPRSAPS